MSSVHVCNAVPDVEVMVCVALVLTKSCGRKATATLVSRVLGSRPMVRPLRAPPRPHGYSPAPGPQANIVSQQHGRGFTEPLRATGTSLGMRSVESTCGG